MSPNPQSPCLSLLSVKMTELPNSSLLCGILPFLPCGDRADDRPGICLFKTRISQPSTLFSKGLQTSRAPWGAHPPMSTTTPNTEFWFTKLWNVASCQLGPSSLNPQRMTS